MISTRRNGFTLFEILIAAALLSVAATIAIPSVMRSYQTHRTMDLGTSSVMESIQTAKSLAIEKSTPCVYEFNPGTNVQWVYLANSPEKKRRFEAPPGIQLQTPNNETKGPTRLVFREDGSTDAFAIRLIGLNQTAVIRVQRHLGIPQLDTRP